MHLLPVAGAIAVSILPLSVFAAVQLTNNDYKGVTAGEPYKLTWSGDGSPVEIILETGASTDLTPVTTLETAATGTSAMVDIPADLKTGKYAFTIKQSGATNYSPQFSIAGTSSSSSSSESDSSSSPKLNTPVAPPSKSSANPAIPYYPLNPTVLSSNFSYPTGGASSSGVSIVSYTGATATNSITPFLNGAGSANGDAEGRVWRVGFGVVAAVVVGMGIGMLA